MSGRYPWPLHYDIQLAPEELARLRTGVGQADRGGTRGWWLLIAAVAVGFGFAALVVVNHTLPPERAGVIAVGGFACCWAGVWLHYAVASAGSVRAWAEAWRSVDHRYAVTLEETGLTYGIAGRFTRTEWWRMARAEERPGAVLLRTGWGNAVAIPSRCFTAEWPVVAVVAEVNR